MRIHHLDCGPARPLGGALMDGVSPGAIGRLTCHCLAVETPRHGVVLVDTGLGMRDMLRPGGRLPYVNSALLRLRTAKRMLAAPALPGKISPTILPR